MVGSKQAEHKSQKRVNGRGQYSNKQVWQYPNTKRERDKPIVEEGAISPKVPLQLL